jgi:hypothetical protein
VLKKIILIRKFRLMTLNYRKNFFWEIFPLHSSITFIRQNGSSQGYLAVLKNLLTRKWGEMRFGV